MTTTTPLKPVTREIRLYGKNGRAQGPTKAYPNPTIVKQEAELIKDFGSGIAVWKFPPSPKEESNNCDYWVGYYNKDGSTSGGGACKTQEEAFKRVERNFAFREYNSRKSEIYRELREELALLEDEYKGSI